MATSLLGRAQCASALLPRHLLDPLREVQATGCVFPLVDFGLRLVLRADEVPEARIGKGRLGQTLWLDPVAGRDGDELCFGSLTESTGAAAGGAS